METVWMCFFLGLCIFMVCMAFAGGVMLLIMTGGVAAALCDAVLDGMMCALNAVKSALSFVVMRRVVQVSVPPPSAATPPNTSTPPRPIRQRLPK